MTWAFQKVMDRKRTGPDSGNSKYIFSIELDRLNCLSTQHTCVPTFAQTQMTPPLVTIVLLQSRDLVAECGVE